MAREGDDKELGDLELTPEERARLEGGQSGEAVEARQREEHPDYGDVPDTLEEAQELVATERKRRQRQERAFRRQIAKLRAANRQQAALIDQTKVTETPKAPELALSENDFDISFDAAGNQKTTLKKEARERLQREALAAAARATTTTAPAAEVAARNYQDVRDEVISEFDDPDAAEETATHLENAFRWLDAEVRAEVQILGRRPSGEDELLDIIDRTGIAESFEERFPDVDMEELLGAASSKRKLKKCLENHMKKRDRSDDHDERPARRDLPARRGARSMARRGSGERRPEGAIGLKRFADMPMEEFLEQPPEVINEATRLARSDKKSALARR